MKRSLLILIVAILAGSALFGSSYLMSRHLCEACTPHTDDLDWVRQEFHLSDADMARVRALHEGYMPKCADMCAQIAAKKRELGGALTGATNVTPIARQKLTELALLRAQCQSQMLEHFIEVSRAMPPEKGSRYLAEMEQLLVTDSRGDSAQTMSNHIGYMHGEH
jgi:hypothetical protein